MKKVIFIASFLLVSGLFAFGDGNYRIIEQLLQKCSNDLGVKIDINGTGIRPVRRQAELMAGMNSTQLNMYGSSSWYVVEMKTITLTGSRRVDEFERLINTARSRGSFVSRHLTGDAVDIAPSTPQVRSWLVNNGITIRDETEDGILCWHLELR